MPKNGIIKLGKLLFFEFELITSTVVILNSN